MSFYSSRNLQILVTETFRDSKGIARSVSTNVFISVAPKNVNPH